MKTISYFTDTVYGRSLEYIVDSNDAKSCQMLTGRKTIDAHDRAAIESLSGGLVTFTQVIKPIKTT